MTEPITTAAAGGDTPGRPARPADVAAWDQARAFVRDLTASGVPVIFADHPAEQSCCWCNCPASAPDTDPCGGCATPAAAILRLYLGNPGQQPDCWPVCRGHYDDCMRAVQLFAASAITGTLSADTEPR